MWNVCYLHSCTHYEICEESLQCTYSKETDCQAVSISVRPIHNTKKDTVFLDKWLCMITVLIITYIVSYHLYPFRKSVQDYIIHKDIVTVRLTILAHSVLMRPNFQGLPWFEFDGLGEDELLVRFCWINNLEKLLWIYFQSLGANLVQVLLHTINVTRITLSRSVFTAH